MIPSVDPASVAPWLGAAVPVSSLQPARSRAAVQIKPSGNINMRFIVFSVSRFKFLPSAVADWRLRLPHPFAAGKDNPQGGRLLRDSDAPKTSLWAPRSPPIRVDLGGEGAG